jgi:hypothetical protein
VVLWVGWMKMVRSALFDEQEVILNNAKAFKEEDDGALSSQVFNSLLFNR